MLPLLLLLLAAAEHCIGIEHKKHPRFTQKGKADAYLRFAGFKVKDCEVSLSRNPEPGCLYGIHDLLETDPLEGIKNQSIIVEKNNKLFLKGYETEVTPSSLISLYYRALFDKENISDNSDVFMSSRDYYTKEQCNALHNAIRNTSHRRGKILVLPESTCVAATLAANAMNGEKIYIVNFQGSKAVGSLFEIEIATEKGKTMRKIKHISSSDVNAVPDDEIERIIVSTLKECLIENSGTPKQSSFLPYDKPSEWWGNISSFFASVASDLGHMKVKTCLWREQEYHNGDDIKYAVKTSVDLAKLREMISEKLKGEEISVPEGAQAHFLSYWPRCDWIANYANGIRSMGSNAILKGVVKFNESNLSFVDPRAVTTVSEMDMSYRKFMDELDYKKKAKTIKATYDEKRPSMLEILEEKAFDVINSVLEQEEKGENGSIVSYSLAYAKKLVDAFTSLVGVYEKKKSDNAVLKYSRDELSRAVKQYSVYRDAVFEGEPMETLEKVKELLQDEENITSASEYDKAVLTLRKAYRPVLDKLRAEEDAKRKAEEEAENERRAKEEAENAEENGEANAEGNTEENGETKTDEDESKDENLADNEVSDATNDNKENEFFDRDFFENIMPKDSKGDVDYGLSHEDFFKKLQDKIKNRKKSKKKNEETADDKSNLEEKAPAREEKDVL